MKIWERYEDQIGAFDFSITSDVVDYCCKGDFDKDGDVDGSDLAVFADAIGSSSGGPDYNPVADFDGDGFADESDLAAFAAEFGRTACPICP